MLLVCGRSIKQTMKTKVILRIPLTDNILEPETMLRVIVRVRTRGLHDVFRSLFWLNVIFH